MKRSSGDSSLEHFRDLEAEIKARHIKDQIIFEKMPESHPHYDHEWKLFWERRCRELKKKDLDPLLYDFKSEWAVFWHNRMKELMDQSFQNKRTALLRKFRLEDPDLEERKFYGDSKPPCSSRRNNNEGVAKVNRIGTSPRSWEDNGKFRNPSPKREETGNTTEGKDSSKSTEIPVTGAEDDLSVIGTLKILNALEDQLGSFGPAITTLLGKAVDCSQKGEDTLELFKDSDNLLLVRYAREKLTSQISAGVLGMTALAKTQLAVEKSVWLQSQVEKKLANEEKYLGLDITGIARATLGRDTTQIAQHIAQQLLQIRVSDVNEGDLQNILHAVLAAHIKLLMETSKKAQDDTPVIDSAAPVSAPLIPASNDPPKVLLDASSGMPEGTKQPLFPSTAPSNSGDSDKMKQDGGDDGDPSDKVSSGSGMLQNEGTEEKGKEIENLSSDDIRLLLANFNSLSAVEKEALTTYLKVLEATYSKKVMKLREEIKKNASSASAKPGKLAAGPQRALQMDSKSHSGQQLAQTSQMLTLEGKVLPAQAGEDRNAKPHSSSSASQPPRASLRKGFINMLSKRGVMDDLRGLSRPSSGLDQQIHVMPSGSMGADAHNMPSSNLDPPSHNMMPTPGRVNKNAQDYGSGMGHKPDHMNRPLFEDGRNHPFPQRPLNDRQEPGPGMPDTKQDRNYDRFGYDPLPGKNNSGGPAGPGSLERRFALPPHDRRHPHMFGKGPQGSNESRDFGPQGRIEPPFKVGSGSHRGLEPNTRQPYRESW